MSLLDNDEGPEPVNALEYLQTFGVDQQQAYQILLHLLFTRSWVMPSDVRECAAELGINLPYVHPGDTRMH
jgi:hypothetical protein